MESCFSHMASQVCNGDRKHISMRLLFPLVYFDFLAVVGRKVIHQSLRSRIYIKQFIIVQLCWYDGKKCCFIYSENPCKLCVYIFAMILFGVLLITVGISYLIQFWAYSQFGLNKWILFCVLVAWFWMLVLVFRGRFAR